MPIRAWSRAGLHRIYISDTEDEPLGYFDLNKMSLNLEDETRREDAVRQLQPLAHTLADTCRIRVRPAEHLRQRAVEERPKPVLKAPYRDLAKNHPGELLEGHLGPTYAKGKAGEQRTAGALGPLQAEKCRVLHSIPLSPQKDLDHLVIAPSGVFVLNTKNVTYPVRVNENGTVYVHDRRQAWVESVERDAVEVRSRLHDLLGVELPVYGVVIVWTGEHDLNGESPNVMTAEDFIERVVQHPRAMTDDLCDYVYSVARRSTSWT